MTELAHLRERLLRDPEVKTAYDRLGAVLEIVDEMVEARRSAGLTREQLAARMGTTTSVVARIESARRMPSLGMIARYADAIGRRVSLHLAPAE